MAKTRFPALAWPLRHLPEITVAGVFPMLAPGCNRIYAQKTIALHLHDYSGDLWLGRSRVRLQPGDLTLSPHFIPSRYALPQSGSHLCIHFVPAEAAPRGHSTQLPLHSRLGPKTAAARERFWRIIDHVRQSGRKMDSASACAASAALHEFLLWLHLQNKPRKTPRRTSLVDQALAKLDEAIETSLAKPMLIGELAAGVGLSAEYVARLFARRYGMTLRHYLLLRRVELARHLLVSSDLLVLEIGRRVGMPDPQYFNKQFRRAVGASPLAYRRQGGNPSPSNAPASRGMGPTIPAPIYLANRVLK